MHIPDAPLLQNTDSATVPLREERVKDKQKHFSLTFLVVINSAIANPRLHPFFPFLKCDDNTDTERIIYSLGCTDFRRVVRVHGDLIP